MPIQRDKLKTLYFGSMAAIVICVYLRFWFISALRDGKEVAKDANQTHSTILFSPIQQKFNIVRYSDIVNVKGLNQSSSFQDTSLLSDKRIYFHETTGRDHLNLRQLCAVESTAKENSNRSIQVFFQSNHVNLTIGPLASILEQYPNIFVILIDVRDYFNQTVGYNITPSAHLFIVM
jgi:lactosylceramide 4-alpha-galactosyltransferase